LHEDLFGPDTDEEREPTKQMTTTTNANAGKSDEDEEEYTREQIIQTETLYRRLEKNQNQGG